MDYFLAEFFVELKDTRDDTRLDRIIILLYFLWDAHKRYHINI